MCRLMGGLWLILVGLVLMGRMGVGVTLTLPTLSGAMMGSLPPAKAGVGAGLQATTREFGSALGAAVVGTVSLFHPVVAS
jgi:hypothetical protein